jgi:hypothetical protein
MTAPALSRRRDNFADDEPELETGRSRCRRGERHARVVQKRGIPIIGFDARLAEEHTARLLGFAPESLRRWRQSDEGPSFCRARGRVSHRLQDLARRWLAEREPR